MEKLRFLEFNENIIETTVKKILVERRDMFPESSDYPLMSFTAGLGVTPKGDRYNREFLVKEKNKKYKQTDIGDFIYSSNNLETGSIGLNKYGKATISPVYSIFFTTEKANSSYIGYLMTQRSFINKMIRYRQGVMYGQWRIHESDFLKIKLSIPSLKEQEKIGRFLSSFDKLILKQQEKIGLLKKLKKGYLQQMFPEKGSNIPKIRFKGFADAWEQYKVSDLFTVTRGNVLATSKTSPTKDAINKYPVYSSQTLRDGLMGYYDEYLFDTAITWTTDGANAGTVRFRRGKFYSTNVNGVLKSDQGYANNAIAEALDLLAWKHVSKVGNPKLMNNVMAEIKLKLPKELQEQEEISALFDALDKLITLHQSKLKDIEELKKGYLQRLFAE